MAHEKVFWSKYYIICCTIQSWQETLKRKRKMQLHKTKTMLRLSWTNKFLWRIAEVWPIHGKLTSLLHQFYENVWKPIICQMNSVMSLVKAFSKPEWMPQVFLCSQLAKLCPILSSLLILDVWSTKKQRSWNLGLLFGCEFMILQMFGFILFYWSWPHVRAKM